MMFKLFIFSVILISTAEFCLANDAEDSTRSKQHIGISVIPIGYGPNPGLSFGATLNIYFSANTVLDFEMIQSGSTYSDLFTSNRVTNLTKSLGVHFRYFMSPSAYIKFGADQRTVDYKYETYSQSVYTENTSFVGTTTAGLISIGNEWQFKNFVLGVDWIGASFPIKSNIDKEYISNSATAAQSSDLKSTEELKLKTTIPIVLRLILGFSF